MHPLFFLIIGFPVIEIYLLIKVGGLIGAFNTIALIIFTAVTGIFFARREGINTLRSGMSQLMRNEMPFYEMLSGATLAFAAILLIIPGFVSDILGFILIIPYTRKLVLNPILSKMKKNKNKDNNETIEVDYEEIKDD